MQLKTSWQCVSALEYSLLLPLPLMAACRQFIASCVHSAGLPCSYTHAKAVLLCNRQTRPGSSAWAAAALTTAREQWEALNVAYSTAACEASASASSAPAVCAHLVMPCRNWKLCRSP